MFLFVYSISEHEAGVVVLTVGNVLSYSPAGNVKRTDILAHWSDLYQQPKNNLFYLMDKRNTNSFNAFVLRQTIVQLLSQS